MSSSAVLPLRMRPDLVVQQQTYRGTPHWLVKDPVALRYYRFEADEFALLEMLDGRTGLRQLEQRFAGTFAEGEIPRFIARLVHAGLVTADVPLAAPPPVRGPRSGLSGLLFWRVPLCDPHRLLTWLERRVGGVFSPIAVFSAALLVLSALILVLAEWETFTRRLPTFADFFGPANLHWLGLSMLLVKLIHEFGHGLACRRFGGECHEMGVMLLVFAPCLYCDVSDCWMLPSKWKRAAVGAAGMYFELIVAALATFAWWWTEPGVVNGLALNILFVSSVSTLLVNLNPLMRYDGYYILSDLLEIPNLRQKSAAAVLRVITWVTVGTPSDAAVPASDERGALLLAYGVAALVYRCLIAVSILVFLYYVLEPYGLQSLGQCLAGALLVSQILVPLRRGLRRLGAPGRWSQVNKMRLLTSAAVVGACLVGLVRLPLPQWVACPYFIQPADAAAVYVDVGGRLVALHVVPGQYVEAGQPIATLENLDLSLAMIDLESRRQQLVHRREQLAERALHEDEAALEIEQVERALAAVHEQITQRREDCERLVLRAPCAGIVLPLPAVADRRADGELRRWSGSLLERRNLGAHVEPGQPVCLVGESRRCTAVLALAQEQLEFVAAGAPVELFPVSEPATVLSAPVIHVARRPMTEVPASLTLRGGGTVATRTTADGRQRPHEAVYPASVVLEDAAERLVPGTTGWAKVHVGHCSLGAHLYRWAEQTLRFL